MQRHQGFKLIELVMVIVILGILASFAVPRFADITIDARKSSVNGLAGSLRSAAALTHATALVKSISSGGSVSMEGNSVALNNYYPTASGIALAMLDTSGFIFSASGTTATFTKDGATTPSSCKATYTEAAVNAAPAVSVTISDC